MFRPIHQSPPADLEIIFSRLTNLANSINDTARMSRATLSLLLLVAIYLAATILSASDEKLFYDGEVGMPNIGISIPLVLGYIIAPPLFLYLHFQVAFLLRVLARKIQTFEAALDSVFGRSSVLRLPSGVSREQFEELLSAFAFVQLYRKDVRTSHMAQFLIWLSMTAVPLFLLLAIDLSFLRYQSVSITWSHHIVALLDLALVLVFKKDAFDAPTQRGRTLSDRSPSKYTQSQVQARSLRTRIRSVTANTVKLLAAISHHVAGSPAQPLYQRVSRTLTFLCAFFVLAIFLVMAHPPRFTDEAQFDAQQMLVERDKLWRLDKFQASHYGMSEIWYRLWKGENWIDVIPCKLVGIGCRYLTVRRSPNPLASPTDQASQRTHSALREKSVLFGDFREAVIYGLALRNIDFRGSDFSGASITNVSVFDSDFSGVDFTNATLGPSSAWRRTSFVGTSFWNADLSQVELVATDLSKTWGLLEATLVGAKLDRADLSALDLSGVDLSKASLRGAKLRAVNFSRAKLDQSILYDVDFSVVDNMALTSFEKADLRRANFSGVTLSDNSFAGADLSNANVKGAQLIRSDFTNATLDAVDFQMLSKLLHPVFQNSSLRRANFSGSTLRHVDFSGADLSRADLTGANLAHADVTNANLYWTDLTSAVLDFAELRGTDLTRSRMRGASLQHADLVDTVLDTAELQDTDFGSARLENANIYWADFTGAELRGTSFSGANLERSSFREASLSQANLRGANLKRVDFRGTREAACSQVKLGLNWHEAVGVESLCNVNEEDE